MEQDADLLMAQLMSLPLTVSSFSKIEIGFTSLVPAHLDSPGKMAVKGCVCGFVCLSSRWVQMCYVLGLSVLNVRTCVRAEAFFDQLGCRLVVISFSFVVFVSVSSVLDHEIL